jgi:hypothetical protein
MTLRFRGGMCLTCSLLSDLSRTWNDRFPPRERELWLLLAAKTSGKTSGGDARERKHASAIWMYRSARSA